MNKPLSEWTLGEIKTECGKREKKCKGCLFDINPNKCRVMEATRFRCPDSWDLFEPPRWTKQDKEDAKAIRHIISCRGLKYGRSAVTGKLYVMWDGSNNVCDIDAITDIGLNPNLLPSLKPGEVVMLDEIIGGGK